MVLKYRFHVYKKNMKQRQYRMAYMANRLLCKHDPEYKKEKVYQHWTNIINGLKSNPKYNLQPKGWNKIQIVVKDRQQDLFTKLIN